LHSGTSAANTASPRVLLVDRPGAVQTVVNFVLPAAPWSDATRLARELATIVLGGTFTSRLNQNLREVHGYTYGARATYVPELGYGTLWASSNVRADVTGASLAEFLKEFRALRADGVSADETEKARTTWRRQRIESFARLSGVVSEALARLRRGADFSSLAEDLARVDQLGEDALDSAAADLVPFEAGILVLVGDAAAIQPQLEGLGLTAPERVDLPWQD
jgi:predicted Zn-dependent peptidase